MWIAFGDAVGYIRILKLDPEFSPPNDTGGKSRYTKYFEQALTSASSYSQRKAHSDWIHRIMYISEINCLVTHSLTYSLAYSLTHLLTYVGDFQ